MDNDEEAFRELVSELEGPSGLAQEEDQSNAALSKALWSSLEDLT